MQTEILSWNWSNGSERIETCGYEFYVGVLFFPDFAATSHPLGRHSALCGSQELHLYPAWQ